ncbi:unnamed protein product, partial [Durusdinium trenchii]
ATLAGTHHGMRQRRGAGPQGGGTASGDSLQSLREGVAFWGPGTFRSGRSDGWTMQAAGE